MAEEKLAVAGRLSSAVAHEIRNPVAIISSSLATAERPEMGEQGRREMYGIARSEAARLERLTGDFLSYARPDRPRRASLSVMEVLGYTAEIAGVHASKKDIAIAVDGDPALRAVADREQIERALLNLLLNAIDATPSGGRVALRCRAAENGLELRGRELRRPDSARGPVPDLRAVLHDQAARDRPRAGDLEERGARARRRPTGGQERARARLLRLDRVRPVHVGVDSGRAGLACARPLPGSDRTWLDC